MTTANICETNITILKVSNLLLGSRQYLSEAERCENIAQFPEVMTSLTLKIKQSAMYRDTTSYQLESFIIYFLFHYYSL